MRAQVSAIDVLSAHADQEEIITWLKGFKTPPKMTFITHGEKLASVGLQKKIEADLKWACQIPAYLETSNL